MYAKKNHSQILAPQSATLPKKKGAKDGMPTYSGDAEDHAMEEGASSSREAAKKETDGFTGHGNPPRRTSFKQNYFANYYQEKTAADVPAADAAFAPSANQVLAYEPVPPQQQYSTTSAGPYSKGKKKGTHKGGQQAGINPGSAQAGKYGRPEGPQQPAMTEAEQRAATKKEIIEAFEIQNQKDWYQSNKAGPKYPGSVGAPDQMMSEPNLDASQG